MNSIFSQLAVALRVEAGKLKASRVVRTTTVLLVVGMVLLAGAFHLAAGAGNEQIIAQLGPHAGTAGWERLLGVASQIAAIGGLLGYGVVISWSMGREFAEGTIGGLFALPVSREAIAAAKLLVFTVWTVAVAALFVLLIALVGAVTGAGPLTASAAGALARLFALLALTGLLAYPAAWASTLGRGLLPGIATSIGIGVLAQIAVVAGAGAWFAVAAPAMWAVSPHAVSAVQLTLVVVVPAVFGVLTCAAWARLQLDR